MKRIGRRTLAAVLAAGMGVLAVAGPGRGEESAPGRFDVSAFVGRKYLDSGDWEPVEAQTEYGVHCVYTPPTWPLGVAAAVLRSAGEETDQGLKRDVTIYEITLGLRKTWTLWSRAHPFLGAGIGLMYVAEDRTVGGKTHTDDGNWTRAGAIGGGLFVDVFDRVYVGLAGRYSKGNGVSLFNHNHVPGGWHVGGLIGFSWGG